MPNLNSNQHSSAAMLYLAIISMSCEFVRGLVVGNQVPSFIQSRKQISSGFNLGSRSQPAFQSYDNRRNKQNHVLRMYFDDMLPTAISSIGSSLASSSILEAASSTVAASSSTMMSSSSSAETLIPTPSTTIPLPPLSPTTVATLLSTNAQLLATDPKLEAELLSDVSAALDFTSLFSPNNTAWIRFCNVIGRILILSSDYIQDDFINPDEFLFQASMLMISIQLLVKSIWPILYAALWKTKLTVRDRRAYTEVFDMVGLTTLQFRTLLATQALAWEELEFGEEVDLENDLCFLYSGQVAEYSTCCSRDGGDGTNVHSNSCHSNMSKMGSRIFGEVLFSKVIEEAIYQKKNTKSGNNIDGRGGSASSKVDQANASQPAALGYNSSSSPSQLRKLTACGPKGATLLRVSSPKLLQLMKDDDQLASSMHRLILLSMREKLSTVNTVGW